MRTAWMIEKADNEHDGCTTGEPLGCFERDGDDCAVEWCDQHDWDNALQFARKQDAVYVARCLIPDMDVLYVEHSWDSPNAESEALT